MILSLTCLSAVCIYVYCRSSQLTSKALAQVCPALLPPPSPVSALSLSVSQDLLAVQSLCGQARKGFREDDVRNYYHHTAGLDYRLLELFCGPGMHSIMRAPSPIGTQGSATRQPTLILGEIRACSARYVRLGSLCV